MNVTAKQLLELCNPWANANPAPALGQPKQPVKPAPKSKRTPIDIRYIKQG